MNLDKGVNDFFRDSEYEVSYGELSLQPLLYQDDMARRANDLESARMGNNRMETMAETKLLDFNLKKSYFIIYGGQEVKTGAGEAASCQSITAVWS